MSNTLKESQPGDVVIIVAKVVGQKNGQTLVEYGDDGKQWSMVNSIGAQIVRPNVDVSVMG